MRCISQLILGLQGTRENEVVHVGVPVAKVSIWRRGDTNSE